MNQPLHISDDRLMDLVNHLLPAEEERQVLTHLELCAQCETHLRQVLADHETAKSMPGPSTRADGNGGVALKRRRPRRLGVIVSVAAAASVIAIAGYIALHRPAPGPYWIETDFITTLQRGEDELAPPQLTNAFATYARHDAEDAVEQLRYAPVPGDEMLSSLRLLLLASAELNAGQAMQSLSDLEKLGIDTLPPQWRSEARWIHYLALRETGETEIARARLQTLMSEDGKIGQLAREEAARIAKH